MNVNSAGSDPAFFQPIILLLFTLVSLGLFGISLWPKWKNLQKAAPENRWDHPLKRFINTLRIAIGQSKMFKDVPAGWMHALIFWGFLILLFRAAQFFLIGFFPNLYHQNLEWSWVNNFYGILKEFFILLVTLACVYALYRRIISKPKRLNLSGEGIFILVLILIIMGSDILYEGAKLKIEDNVPSLWSFLSSSFASLCLENSAFSHLNLYQGLGFWLHVGAILVFLNVLPRSKHFHVITSIPNVFFSNVSGTGNQIQKLNFEDENIENFGVTKIEEFSWKKILDLHTCTECGRCDVFCPALNSQKPLSPKQFTVDLRDFLNANLDLEEKSIMGNAIHDETVWSCTTCGACEEECPVMIEYVNKMIDLRRGLVLMEDRYPKELTEAFRSLETHSNPWGFPGNQREAWAKKLEVPIWDTNNPSEYLYFVGCNGSFDNRGKMVFESVVLALKKAGVDFSILGNREGCTGDPARRLGNEYLFDILALKNVETFKEEKIRKVITHCPHCFNSLLNEYPEYGIKLEVIHHSQLLEHLVKEGKISSEVKSNETVVVHDSCYMGRHNNEYDAPRETLKSKIEDKSILEVETSRERGTCCGAGGGRFLIEENTGTRISHNRIDELMETNPDTIAVSCPYCVLMLEDALKAKKLNEKVKVKDISEFL